MWEVFVKGVNSSDGALNKTCKLEVPENSAIDVVYQKLMDYTGIDKNQLLLVYGGKNLEMGKGKVLRDYNVESKTTLFLVFRMNGGVNPKNTLHIRKRELQPLPGYIKVTSTEEDMISQDDNPDEKRAIMPCGHVIGVESMTSFCKSVLEKGLYEFFCPHVDDRGKSDCSALWELFLVKHVACLSDEEWTELETKVTETYLRKASGIQQCPGCESYVTRNPGVKNCVRCPVCTKKMSYGYDFCWACLQPWNGSPGGSCGNGECDGLDPRIKHLTNCEVTKVRYIGVECPSVRACPKCGILIQHIADCKHMDCQCGHKFCFVCLKGKVDGQWECGGYNVKCEVAPRQTSLPGDV